MLSITRLGASCIQAAIICKQLIKRSNIVHHQECLLLKSLLQSSNDAPLLIVARNTNMPDTTLTLVRPTNDITSSSQTYIYKANLSKYQVSNTNESSL